MYACMCTVCVHVCVHVHVRVCVRVCAQGGGAAGRVLGGQSRSKLHVVVPVTSVESPSPAEEWTGAIVQSTSEVGPACASFESTLAL